MADFRFGIEEEFFLADAQTRGTPRRGVKAFHEAAGARLPRVERELLQSQVEISTPPSTSFSEARAVLGGLRQSLATLGQEHGILVFAAGTHPVVCWSRQRPTAADRYERVMRELRMLGKRNVVCGLHVHVEVPKPAVRVELMNRMLPFLPTLLALSASSPFWQARPTGLAGYRLCAFGELPRTGLPDLFADAGDYERYVRIMTGAGAIRDASFLWWAIRPSVKYPTLELRVADSCTRLDDALAIAALYRCILRLLHRRPEVNKELSGASRAIAAENLWRAQAEGVRAEFVDEDRESAVPFADHLAHVLAQVSEDAEALGCGAEVGAALAIAQRGTSADGQMRVFREARQANARLSGREAVNAVVDWLAAQTARI
ncbi:MAG TPA: carboxylate-amine ligase [Mesorhizobium sp.]|jgi:carboxylate-amine ligase|nr:carboxylate-amine ligase [Mesorhizobium sp.]